MEDQETTVATTVSYKLRFSMEAEKYPRLIYTTKEDGKEDRTIASPYIHISNPSKLAYALREMVSMIEQLWMKPE